MARIGESADLFKCSFCGKSQKQVKKLIAGPGVYICDECIDLCNEIIEEEFSDDTPAQTGADLPRPAEIRAFLDETRASEGAEISNTQKMFVHLCRVLGVDEPRYKKAQGDNPYCFEEDVKDAQANRRIDVYYRKHFAREYCFLFNGFFYLMMALKLGWALLKNLFR